jgi:holo-[acyl-carrier protein] synthase
MIIGTGVDIIEISRIRSAVDTHGERFLTRVLNSEEITYGKAHAVPYPHYAGRFAAKEAIYKALGNKKLTWKDITVINDPDGKPECRIKGLRRGLKVHLSISHSKYYAVASVVVETKE